MEIWFLENEERLLMERQAISKLENEVDWLTCLFWQIDKGLLHMEAIIHVDSYDYHIILSYPNLFPDTPAWIKPKNPEEKRWSGHQYGQGGTLCLEWGQDNWHPDLTGSHLLESAYRLLSIEKSHGQDDNQQVFSRHKLTIGQEL